MSDLFTDMVKVAKDLFWNPESLNTDPTLNGPIGPRTVAAAVVSDLNIVQVSGVLRQMAVAEQPAGDMGFIESAQSIGQALRELLTSALADQLLADPDINAAFLRRRVTSSASYFA